MRYPFNIPKVITRTFQNHVETTGMATAGVDYGNMPDGTPLYAIEDGSVAMWVDNTAGGDIGLDLYGSGRTWKYNHLSSHVGGNRKVKEGDLIAYSGHSGNATGPHLCLACIIGGVRQDAEIIFNENSGMANYIPGDKVIITKQSINDPINSIMGAYAGTVGTVKQGPRYIDGVAYYDLQCANGTGFVRVDHLGLTDQPINAIGPNYELDEANLQESYTKLQLDYADLSKQMQVLNDNMIAMQADYEKQLADQKSTYEKEIATLEARIAVLESGATPVPPIQVTADISVFGIRASFINIFNKIALLITKK